MLATIGTFIGGHLYELAVQGVCCSLLMVYLFQKNKSLYVNFVNNAR